MRDAIVATEDKHFFAHNGVGYSTIPRVLSKIRIGAFLGRLVTGGRHDNTSGRAIFPQGGSTITQQLVRGYFLQRLTSEENSYTRRNFGVVARAMSWLIGERNVNMVFRKREEMRLSMWLEEQMRERFGSKRRAKEEIFARYASFVYMSNGQYGFARAADYYFGRLSPRSRPTTPISRQSWRALRSRRGTTRRRRAMPCAFCAVEIRSWCSWPHRVSFLARR